MNSIFYSVIDDLANKTAFSVFLSVIGSFRLDYK